MQQLVIAADTMHRGDDADDCHQMVHLNVFDFGLLLVLLLQVLIKRRQFFDILQNKARVSYTDRTMPHALAKKAYCSWWDFASKTNGSLQELYGESRHSAASNAWSSSE